MRLGSDWHCSKERYKDQQLIGCFISYSPHLGFKNTDNKH